MSSTVYQTIKSQHRLPSPTGVAFRVLELAQKDDTTVHAMAAAVETDPATAARLLKVVNSSLTGMPRPISSVQRAVALLGTKTVTNLALAFSLVSTHRKGACRTFNYELFWSESAARAVAALHIARHVKCPAPDEAFTCGLLCQIGRLALATAFPERYADVIQAAANGSEDGLTDLEAAVFSIDHCELAADMMADWRIPATFCEAVRAQGALESPDSAMEEHALQLARILHLTGWIASALTQPTVYRETVSGLAEEAAGLGITPYVCYDMLDAIAREWHDMGTILSVGTRQVPPLAEMYARARERQAELTYEQATTVSGAFEGGGNAAG